MLEKVLEACSHLACNRGTSEERFFPPSKRIFRRANRPFAGAPGLKTPGLPHRIELPTISLIRGSIPFGLRGQLPGNRKKTLYLCIETQLIALRDA